MFKTSTACLLSLIMYAQLSAAETWPFTPDKDSFSEDALFDLRSLNEERAGQHGWIRTNEAGDFVRGDGKEIRFWAINTIVERSEDHKRPLWNHMQPGDLAYHARWIAKRGVNMIRLGVSAHGQGKTHERLEDVNQVTCEWVWKAVGAMSKEGVYSTVSPYWAFALQSDDKKWGTDWEGIHNGLLFFDERMQAAYKNWVKVLLTTKTPYLEGKSLAEHPGMAIFQIQNEDSMLFWTINRMSKNSKIRLGKQFAAWSIKKYGSLDKALEIWGPLFGDNDDLANSTLDIMNIWHFTEGGRKQAKSQRANDQLQFFTELMHNFNKEIGRYIREDLNCPVLINAGNWKSGDTVLLNDAERYSYTANEVIAVNRYFSGMHNGKNRGWAIVNGDEYTNKSAVKDGALDFPLNLKQVAGKPMIIPESLWVFPEENTFEASLLVAAYSCMNGVDATYWNAADANDWTHPKAANGYMPSMKKWICVTPDLAGHWPAAAYLMRKGLVKRGTPVVHEHRSLASIYQGKKPIIAETASFDPNRDAGDFAANSAVKAQVTPWAFLAGPVTVTYNSDESKSTVANLDALITDSGNGKRVKSITGELVLDTGRGLFTVNTPQCQAFTGHFQGEAIVQLPDIRVMTSNSELTVTVVTMDDKPIKTSGKIFLQVGNKCRPTNWTTEPCQIQRKDKDPVPGLRVTNYGSSPWQIRNNQGSIRIRNNMVNKATVLDMNGMATGETPLTRNGDQVTIALPEHAFYVMFTP